MTPPLTRKRKQQQQQQSVPSEGTVQEEESNSHNDNNDVDVDVDGDNNEEDDDLVVEKYVDEILKDHGMIINDEGYNNNNNNGSSSASLSTTTKSGWCLKEGLIHIIKADNSVSKIGVGNITMKQLIKQHGPPKIFTSIMSTTTTTTRKNGTHEQCRHDDDDDDDDDDYQDRPSQKRQQQQPKNCFQSLCRIIAGQQLAGSAARAMWNRLLQVTNNDLSPQTILNLVNASTGNNVTIDADSGGSNDTTRSGGMDIEALRKPAGLSNAKAKSIVALSEAFVSGELSEQFLTSSSSSSSSTNNNNNDCSNEQDKIIRETLLGIKGIGPWSCDMFLMFYLEKPNILPIGDLGVRKGMQKYCFSLQRGKGKRGSLCPKHDLQRILTAAKRYQPYQSIFSYYMWKVADTPDFYSSSNNINNSNSSRDDKESSSAIATTTTTAGAAAAAKQAVTPKAKKTKSVSRQVTP